MRLSMNRSGMQQTAEMVPPARNDLGLGRTCTRSFRASSGRSELEKWRQTILLF